MTAPTVEGWYWALNIREAGWVVIDAFHLGVKDDYLTLRWGYDHCEASEFSQFLGPIPPPPWSSCPDSCERVMEWSLRTK